MRLLLILLLLLPAAAAPTWGEQLDGTWVHAGGEEELAGVTAAIDRTIDSMAAPMRPFARKRMHSSIAAVGTYVVRLDGDVLMVGKDGRDPKPIFLDGQARDERSGDGKTATVRSDLLADGVRHHWSRDDSSGSDTFRLLDDGRLAVERVIDSSWFREPVRFTTTYRR
jgi:hypothetical protein